MTTCYNPERRIFFVHIPKCAGTSIGGRWNGKEWTDCWLNQAIGGFTRKGLPNGHQPVSRIQELTGRPIPWWDKIIVTIRNPFEQQLSQWSFWRKRAAAHIKRGSKLHNDDRFVTSPGMTFERFLEDPRSNGPNAICGSSWKDVGGVFRWWCQSGGVIPPNVRVIRTEDLPVALFNELQLDAPPELPIKNTSEHGDWREVYTPPMIETVRRKFAWSLATKYAGILDAEIFI